MQEKRMRHKPLAALAFIVCVAFLTPVAHARTLTFDDVEPGTVLESSALYRDTYRVRFLSTFQTTTHSGVSWGAPRSSPNVAALGGVPGTENARLLFGRYTTISSDLDDVRSVGAYFSTDLDVQIRITAHRWVPDLPYSVPVASVTVGAAGGSWDNHYSEIISTDAPFYKLIFEGVNSPNDLLGFCIDDMTITYVPEPSSVLALCAGIGAMGAVIRRRRG
jgi:hypothetical protein